MLPRSGTNGNNFYRMFTKPFATANITVVAIVFLAGSDGAGYYMRITAHYSSSFHYYMFLNNGVTPNQPPFNYYASGY